MSQIAIKTWRRESEGVMMKIGPRRLAIERRYEVRIFKPDESGYNSDGKGRERRSHTEERMTRMLKYFAHDA